MDRLAFVTGGASGLGAGACRALAKSGCRVAVVDLNADLAKVSPWSAETPTLYTVVVSLLDATGKEVEATRTRLGFRTVEIRNRSRVIT